MAEPENPTLTDVERLVVLELKCSCCGRVLEKLTTHWLLEDVRPESIWTRQPCTPCEVILTATGAGRYDPRD